MNQVIQKCPVTEEMWAGDRFHPHSDWILLFRLASTLHDWTIETRDCVLSNHFPFPLAVAWTWLASPLTYFKKWLGPSPEYGTLSVPVLGKFYHMRSTVQLSSLPEPLQQQVFPHLTAEHSWSLIWVTIAMADLEKSKSLKGKPI